MSKRRYGEGIITLIAELGLGGGALACYLNMGHNQAEIDKLKATATSYNNYETEIIEATRLLEADKTGMYACLGVAGAVYIFNIIRAVTAKPKYRNNIALTPTIIPFGSDMAYGLNFSYSF